MGISHSWNGTVLTITSDSGTSSADLKGDMGVRGAQGVVDMSLVYTKDNPPTREELNAAPAGYGLGGAGTTLTVSTLADLDTVSANGWYKFVLPALIQEAGVYLQYCYMRVDANNANAFTQTIYVVAKNGTRLIRNFQNGVFSEWCVENPNMNVGVEYRTTERWNGKVVYKKIVNFGELPNATTKYVDCGLTSCKVVNMDGFAYMTSGVRYSFPVIVGEEIRAYMFYGSSGQIAIRALTDMSGYYANLIISYTKE